MSRSRGDISNTGLNQSYPHQVALAYEACTGKNHEAADRLSRSLGAYWRRRSAHHGAQQFLIFCFKEPEDAAQFKERLGGIPFYPEDLKGKVWDRPPGDVRRPRKLTKREIHRLHYPLPSQ